MIRETQKRRGRLEIHLALQAAAPFRYNYYNYFFLATFLLVDFLTVFLVVFFAFFLAGILIISIYGNTNALLEMLGVQTSSLGRNAAVIGYSSKPSSNFIVNTELSWN